MALNWSSSPFPRKPIEVLHGTSEPICFNKNAAVQLVEAKSKAIHSDKTKADYRSNSKLLFNYQE